MTDVISINGKKLANFKCTVMTRRSWHSTRMQKPTPEKVQHPAVSGCGEVTLGKPGVAIIACAARHYSTENPA